MSLVDLIRLLIIFEVRLIN